MVKEVVIFDARREARKRRVKKSLTISGNLLLIGSFFGLFLIFGPSAARWANYRLTGKTSPEIAKVRFGDLTKPLSATERASIPDPDFSLVIPKIGVRAKVIFNVDPSNPNEYQKVLKNNVAHAKGKAFPGMTGTVYLFGHSSQFPSGVIEGAVFAFLDKLEKGDQVVVYFSSVKYLYAVTEKKILENGDLQYYYQDTPQQRLVLQTCWPAGTSLKQLIVIARPVYLSEEVKIN